MGSRHTTAKGSDPLAWQKSLEQVLFRGETGKDMQLLSYLLSSARAPDVMDWSVRPSWSAATEWGALPCWTRLLANQRASESWIKKALEELQKAGVDLGGSYVRRSRTVKASHQAATTWEHRLVEPIFRGLMEKVSHVNFSALAALVPLQPWLSESHPDREEVALEWVLRQMSMEKERETAQPTTGFPWLRALVEKVPALKEGPSSKKIWLLGLGLAQPGVRAPSSLKWLSLSGLSGHEILTWDDVSSPVRQAWTDQSPLDWQDAPAWAWAIDRQVFNGSGLLLKECQNGQPRPWDPNEKMPNGMVSIGEWLLRRALAANDTNLSVLRRLALELDELKIRWVQGTEGKTPYDLLVASGRMREILGQDRWDILKVQAKEHRLDTTLSPGEDRQEPRFRI